MKQTYADIEIIIYDDGSTDGTEEFVTRLNDPRIQYFGDKHRGVSYARNCLLQMARGEYSCWQDSDDMSNIYRIERQLAVLKNQKCVCVSSCHTKLFSHNKKDCYEYPGLHDGDKGNSLGSMMFRTAEAVKFIEGVDFGGEDVDWKRDMRLSGVDFFNLPERLYYIRLTNTDRIGCLKYRMKKERKRSNEQRRKGHP
jgi:glycosyltransferase involved in cell wall biosynthesis